jgi:hypothetical protein
LMSSYSLPDLPLHEFVLHKILQVDTEVILLFNGLLLQKPILHLIFEHRSM